VISPVLANCHRLAALNALRCAEHLLMHKSAVASISVLALSVGIAMMGVAAVFLRRLDDRAFGDPVPFYASVRHYGSLGWHGALIALAGCVGLALLLDWKKGFQAATICGLSGFLVLTLGLYVFPIHFPSGAMYLSLLTFTSGACAAFALTATARYVWFRTHQSSRPAGRAGYSC